MTEQAYVEVKTTAFVEAVNYNAHHGYGNGQEKVLVQERVAKALEVVGEELYKRGIRLHVFEGAVTVEQYKKRYEWAIETMEVDESEVDACCTTLNGHKAKEMKNFYEPPKVYDGRYASGLYVTVGLCDFDGNVLPRPNMFEETIEAWGFFELLSEAEKNYKEKLKEMMESEGFKQVSVVKWYEYKYEGA